MSWRCLKNVLSNQNNFKTILRGLENVLCRPGYSTEKKTFLNFFGLCFTRFVLVNPCVVSNKIPWSIQTSKQRRFTALMNIFSRSHVSYCPFVGMWHGRILDNRIFRRHLQEKHSSYQCLLAGDRSVSILNGNLEIPATE